MRVPQIRRYQDPSQPDLGNAGSLALALQEALTVVARLRTGTQIANDAESFRAHIKRLLTTAHQELQTSGYSDESMKLAVYAFVAFLDESVLASAQPMFSAWSRQPLQEEIFGDHTAGETFFRNVEDLLHRRPDTETADVLEVYQLCLLLGFHGRYRDDRLQLGRVRETIDQRIAQVRGERPLSPDWAHPHDGDVSGPRDPWIRPLGGIATAVLLGLIVAFVAYTVLLGQRIDLLESTATRVLGVG